MPELEALVRAARAHWSETSRQRLLQNPVKDPHKLQCARWFCRITRAGRAGVPTGPTKKKNIASLMKLLPRR
jgi:hypothetical protein